LSEGRARVLVVDDEPAILRTLRTHRRGHGETAENVRDALAEYERTRPDIVLLDLGLPDDDGLALIRGIRERAPTPIIVVSARDAEQDKVSALDLGADDYLTKPFSVDELLARIRVALRHVARPATGADAVFTAGQLRVDLGRRDVRVGSRPVRLTPTEYDVLKALIGNPDRVLTFSMLLRQVWGPGYSTEGHYLHVYIARLRKKLEDDPQAPRWIISEPGVGYRFRADGA
jgi:two-component system KDP operon response regulator KdpE